MLSKSSEMASNPVFPMEGPYMAHMTPWIYQGFALWLCGRWLKAREYPEVNNSRLRGVEIK